MIRLNNYHHIWHEQLFKTGLVAGAFSPSIREAETDSSL